MRYSHQFPVTVKKDSPIILINYRTEQIQSYITARDCHYTRHDWPSEITHSKLLEMVTEEFPNTDVQKIWIFYLPVNLRQWTHLAVHDDHLIKHYDSGEVDKAVTYDYYV